MTTLNRLVRNYHFWLLVSVMIFIIFLYFQWPWREVDIYLASWRGSPWIKYLNKLAVWEFNVYIVGSLFLLPIIYSIAVFKWKTTVVISIISIICILILIIGLRNSIQAYIVNIVLLLIPAILLVFVTFMQEVRQREKLVSEEKERERRIYVSKIIQAQEQERKHIANELHDDTIQSLIAVAQRVELINSECKSNISSVHDHISWIHETVLETVEKLRKISLHLRPTILDELGLVPALKWLVMSDKSKSTIPVKLIISEPNQQLDPNIEVTVFRIVQEALNNIQRHSKAKQAVVTIEFNTGSIEVNIQDDGQGFIFPEKFSKFVIANKLGLSGLKTRIDALGGTFKIYSKTMKGTTLNINIPI